MPQGWEGPAGTLRALAIACLALAPPAGAAAQSTAASPASAGFEAGMDAAQRGDLFRAATIFNTLLQQRPHDPGAYIGLAEVQVRSGHLDEADAWLVRGVAANPHDANLLHARAHVALLQHRDSAAADFLAQALMLDPEDSDSRRELADLYAGPLGRPDQALALRQAADRGGRPAENDPVRPRDRRQAAAAAPDSKPRPSADLYYRLGLAASAHGNLAQAQRFLEKAMALRPWMADAQTALWSLADKTADIAAAPRRSAQKIPRARDKNS